VRALVTGAGGFVGQCLCQELLRDGWDVHGATLTGAPAGGILEDWQRDAVFWHDVDLRDADETGPVIEAARPDAVFHLASVSRGAEAEEDEATARSTNIDAAMVLLDAVEMRQRAGVINPVIIIVGSGEQYGSHKTMPLREDAEQRAITVFARTKVEQEAMTLARFHESGVRVVAARPFAHSGRGQPSTSLLPGLIERAREAFEQRRDTIAIGNAGSVCDFLHVEDVARAYIYLALRGQPGEAYNVCSGTGISVAELAAKVIDAVGDSMRWEIDGDLPKIRAVPDPSLTRAGDIPLLVGDPTKLKQTTTWEPKHSLDMLIDDLIYAEEN
jgi:GDP-4-dehydro-6-deoxy-D-mannose reductase